MRARQGDPRAWRRLVEVCAPVVARWCRRLGVANADVDDVVQDVFVTLHRGLDSFERRPNGSFAAWLYTLTRCRAVDRQRRVEREPRAPGGSSAQERLEQEPVPEELSSDGLPAGFDADLYRRILDFLQREFEPNTWQAFWRSVVEEQSTEAIAAELKMTTNAVRVAKSRVLRRLRGEFGDLLPPEEGSPKKS
jgi:RNA polymerase sigma-70 factor (ECF subfamily)